MWVSHHDVGFASRGLVFRSAEMFFERNPGGTQACEDKAAVFRDSRNLHQTQFLEPSKANPLESHRLQPVARVANFSVGTKPIIVNRERAGNDDRKNGE